MGDDRGSGLVGTVSGVAVFLAFLCVAVHVLAHLYATSVVTAVAFDAARVVSGAAHGSRRPAAAADAEANARALLGDAAASARFEWLSVGPDVVVLRIRMDRRGVLPPPVAAIVGLNRIDRTIRVRAEGWR